MLSDLLHNQVIIICACSWIVAQILKVIVVFVQEKRVAWHNLVTSGGMPSSHSALVCALVTCTAMLYGLGSISFTISAVLAVIVMYDSAGVRQSVGQQSAVINRIVKEFRFRWSKYEMEKELREFIGHTPIQVGAGALIGILIAWLWLTLSGA
jgi:uncharacterized protein